MMMTVDGGASRLATWDDELEELYARLSGRGGFRWDAASDGLYRAARDRAVTDGRLAMQDTMGRAAALTGGYGSSYSQAVGQREYDDYLRSLGEAMPQFYSMARQNWQDEGDALRDRYELLYRRASDERDRLAAADRAAADAAEEARARQDAADRAAAQRRQQGFNALVKIIQSSGYRPSDAELESTGLSRAAADALAEAWLGAQKSAKSARSGGSSSSGAARTKEKSAKKTAAGTAKKPALPAVPAAAGGGSGARAMTVR